MFRGLINSEKPSSSSIVEQDHGKIFEDIEGFNIDTNSLDARRIIESTNLGSIEYITYSDIKNLFTKVSLKEAIDTVFRKLYEQDRRNHRQWEERH